MLAEQPQQRLLRLAQVAQMMQVHPKSVYYWVRTGRLAALTSPGGLLRVRAEDARALCQNAGLPVPAEHATVKRRVNALEADKQAQKSVQKALKAKGFDVLLFEDPYDALIATAKEPPEALLVSTHAGFDVARLATALRRDEATRRTRVLAFADDESAAAAMTEAGIEPVLPAGDANALAKLFK